jgi:Fe-S-cluster containining protein
MRAILVRTTMRTKPRLAFYDCSRCPAYCCTYARIAVTDDDVARLAARFGIPVEEATRKFTTRGAPGERVLRHRKDEIFGTACRFLDPRTRRCTVYEDRPGVCREYPDSSRCGYYDFLSFERRAQDDEDVVVSASVQLSDAGLERLEARAEAPAPREPRIRRPRK